MNKEKSPFIIVLPNFIAGILFLLGSFRFYTNSDDFGASLFLAAGIIFIVVGIINIRKLKK